MGHDSRSNQGRIMLLLMMMIIIVIVGINSISTTTSAPITGVTKTHE